VRCRLFEWAMRRAGVQWGDRLPRWARVLRMLLFPSLIRLWIGSGFYDAATDTINIRGVKLSVHGLEIMFGQPSSPGHWFRVQSVTNGRPTIECRVDGYVSDRGPTP